MRVSPPPGCNCLILSPCLRYGWLSKLDSSVHVKQEAEWEDLGSSQARDWPRHRSDVTTDKAKEGTGKELQTLFQGTVVCLPTTSVSGTRHTDSSVHSAVGPGPGSGVVGRSKWQDRWPWPSDYHRLTSNRHTILIREFQVPLSVTDSSTE